MAPAYEPVAEVLMTRTVFRGAFLLIEGDDDVRFWQRYVSHENCRIIKCGGKRIATTAVARLQSHGVRGVVAVIDRDLDDIIGTQINHPDIIITECHDLESHLVQSNALDGVLSEYGDTKKVACVQQAHGLELREIILAKAKPFALARWWLLAAGHRISFDRFKIPVFVDERTWEVDEGRLLAEVSRASGIDEASISAAFGTCPQSPLWILCHGKDLIHVLGVGLRAVLGDQNPGYDKLASGLRQAFDRASFGKFNVTLSLIRWEEANKPFRVLAETPIA